MPCNNDQNKDKKTCTGVYWWYLRFTAIGGLSQAGGTEHRLNHLLWLLLTLLGAGLTSWNVYQVVVDYLSNEVGFHNSSGF